MRKLAFAITLTGLIALAILIRFNSPIEVNSQKDIANLQDNQKVVTSSQVINERISSNYRTITLANNLTLYCICKNVKILQGKNITVIGAIDTYQKSKINVLEIK